MVVRITSELVAAARLAGRIACHRDSPHRWVEQAIFAAAVPPRISPPPPPFSFFYAEHSSPVDRADRSTASCGVVEASASRRFQICVSIEIPAVSLAERFRRIRICPRWPLQAKTVPPETSLQAGRDEGGREGEREGYPIVR